MMEASFPPNSSVDGTEMEDTILQVVMRGRKSEPTQADGQN